jgi:hypothetical protein
MLEDSAVSENFFEAERGEGALGFAVRRFGTVGEIL